MSADKRKYTLISTTNALAVSSATPDHTPEQQSDVNGYPKATPWPQRASVGNLHFLDDYKQTQDIPRFGVAIIYRVWTSFPHETHIQFEWLVKTSLRAEPGHFLYNEKLKSSWMLFKSLHGVQLGISGYRDIRPFEFYCFVNGILEINLPPEAISTSKDLSQEPQVLELGTVCLITRHLEAATKNVLLETLISAYKLGRRFTEEELKKIGGVSQFTIALKLFIPTLDYIYAELEKISLNHGWPCWFEMILPYREFNMKSEHLGFEIRKDINSFTTGEYYSFHPDTNEHQFPPVRNRRSEVTHKCFKKLAKLTCKITEELCKMKQYFLDPARAVAQGFIPQSIQEIIAKMKELLNSDYKGPVDGVIVPPKDYSSSTTFPKHIVHYVKEVIMQMPKTVRPTDPPNTFGLWPPFVQNEFYKRDHIRQILENECNRFHLRLILNDGTGEIDGIQAERRIQKGDKVVPFAGIITYLDHFERTAYKPGQKFGRKDLNVTKQDLVNYSFAIPFEDLQGHGWPKVEASSHSISVTPFEFSCARYMVQNSDGFFMDKNGLYKKIEVNNLKNSNVYLSIRFNTSLTDLIDYDNYSLRAKRDIEVDEFIVINRRAGIDVTDNPPESHTGEKLLLRDGNGKDGNGRDEIEETNMVM